MTTSGTVAFNLDLNAIVEEAFERNGMELRTGYDLRTARRSLNLLTVEWASRGVNLWLLDQQTIPLFAGIATYALPIDTIDLLDHVIRTQTGMNQSDLTISRISASTYITIPNKNMPGRPIQLWIDRQSGASYPDLRVAPPSVTVWPVPEQDNYYTLVYNRLRRIQDITDGTDTGDIPFRFIPALVAGLAYHLCLKLPNALPRLPMLKDQYDTAWQEASDEDREKATLRIVPREQYI
jgi:hypothetical protein